MGKRERNKQTLRFQKYVKIKEAESFLFNLDNYDKLSLNYKSMRIKNIKDRLQRIRDSMSEDELALLETMEL